MSLHLTLLVIYSFTIVGLGIWTARFVRGSSEFFVAGRSLGPGLILASMLAANIGAGSTVGAAGLGVSRRTQCVVVGRIGGLGSIVFAFFVAPRLWQLAKDHDFYTTGDYLEFRYGPAVRGVTTASSLSAHWRCSPDSSSPARRFSTSSPACRAGPARSPAAPS